MAGRVRMHDWAATPLGPIAGWSPALRTVVDLVLASPVPTGLAWGEERTLICNDALAECVGALALGGAAPQALVPFGVELADCLETAWCGTGARLVDQPSPRPGSAASGARVDLACAPVRGERGEVAGVLMIVTEAVERAPARGKAVRRQAFLLGLSDQLRAASDPDVLAEEAVGLLLKELDLERCYLVSLRQDEGWAEVTRQVAREGLELLPSHYDLSDYPQTLRQIPQRTAVIEDIFALPGLGDVEKRVLESTGQRAFVAPALRRGGAGPIWIMVGVSSSPRRWEREEIALMEEAAERTWAAMERVRAEAALRDSEVRLQTLVSGMPQLVWRAMGEGDWTWASPQWTEFTGQAEEESHGWGWLEPLLPSDRALARRAWEEAVQVGHLEVDYRVRRKADGLYRWFQTRATPVRDADGIVVEWLGTSTDVQDLRALQERQRVLLHELQHRVRNTLAVVRSIVSRTGETSETVDDFASHLEGRLNALARTQIVLTRAPGEGVDLETMVREELLAQAARETQVEIGGPDVRLPPKAAEVLALAIHELATNAIKYGALSAPAGWVHISWALSDQEGRPWLGLTWEETGVRVASAAPRREGFGSDLIQMRVPYELRGHGSLQFRPGGVRCEISFPLTASESILQTNAPGADVRVGG